MALFWTVLLCAGSGHFSPLEGVHSLATQAFSDIAPAVRDAKSHDVKIRLRAATTLSLASGSNPMPEAARRAMVRLAEDPDARVRDAVLPGIWRVAVTHRNDKNGEVDFVSGPYDPIAFPALLSLGFDPHPSVRGRALGRLAYTAGLQTWEEFNRYDGFTGYYDGSGKKTAKALVEGEPAVRAAAVAVAFARSQGYRMRVPGLADRDPLVRQAALLGLRRGYDLVTERDLLAHAKGSNIVARTTALAALEYAKREGPLARRLVIRLDTHGRRMSDGYDLDRVGAGGVPEMIRLIPLARHAFVLERLGRRLRELGATQAILPLVERLCFIDRGYDTSDSIYDKIRDFGWQATGPLIRGLDCPKESIRAKCVTVLAWLPRTERPDARLPPALLRASHDESPTVRAASARALVDRADIDDKTLGRAIELADDPNSGVRKAAVESLARFLGVAGRNEATLEAIHRMMGADDPTRRTIASVVDRRLGETPAPVADPFAGSRSPDLDVRLRSAEILSERAAHSAPSLQLRSALLRLSRDEDEQVRVASVPGLVRLSGPIENVEPVAFRAVLDLADDPYAVVREATLRRLARHVVPNPSPLWDIGELTGLPESAYERLAAFRTAKAPALRAAAIVLGHGHVQSDPDLPAMTDPDPLVRHAALLGFGDDRSGKEYPFLLSLLRHPLPGVRADAADGLARALRPEAIPALKLLLRDGDRNVRIRAKEAISNLRGDYLLPVRR